MTKLKPKDNMMFLAALLVVVLGLFAYSRYAPTPKEEVKALSDEVSAIEKDLKATDVTSIDSDLPMVEGELK